MVIKELAERIAVSGIKQIKEGTELFKEIDTLTDYNLSVLTIELEEKYGLTFVMDVFGGSYEIL